MDGFDWNRTLREQCEFHWDHQVRDRLAGLTDDEYGWSPGPDGWSVRPRGTSPTPMAGGSGEFTIDFTYPEPVPAPFTTIAWRLGHVIVGVLGERNARYFEGPAVSYPDFDYPDSAARSLALLDEFYARWIRGVRDLDTEGLTSACGEPGFEASPMADLVLHIHRELIHHLSEVCLLRDLYLHEKGATR